MWAKTASAASSIKPCSTSAEPVAEVSPFTPVTDGVNVALKVHPGARRTEVRGLAPDDDGGVALKVAVTAAPENGKANRAVIAALADAWGVAKSSIELIVGAADRRKAVHVAGNPVQLLTGLEAWLIAQGT